MTTLIPRPQRYDLDPIYRGTDVVQPMKIIQEPDITSWTLRAVLKELFGADAPELAELDTDITDGPEAEFDLIFSRANSNQVPGHYKYEVRRIDDGSNTMVAEGVVPILATLQA